ncbi:MAG: YqaJ viral recombinase family protein [Micrococcales bacterium]|nr:YqaJ viral recombinase family protein [Micrococcales bacterium]
MALHVYNDLVQGSDEWLAARRGIVTASVVGQLITPSTIKPANNDKSRALTTLLVAERITGWTDPVYVSDDMMRGTLDEPIARAIYAEHYAPVDQVGFMVREEDGWRLGYSPDGLVGDDGLIEIKSRRAKTQLTTILRDEVPAENMAQIQAGLLVSGRKWCDYVSFCGGMPLYVRRVHRDQRWFDAIEDAVTAFETTAAEMVDRYTTAITGRPATERINHFQEASL